MLLRIAEPNQLIVACELSLNDRATVIC